jgi:hypothetical protein
MNFLSFFGVNTQHGATTQSTMTLFKNDTMHDNNIFATLSTVTINNDIQHKNTQIQV